MSEPTPLEQRRARLAAAKALKFTTGLNAATGHFDTPVERELYHLAGTCWNHLQRLIADLGEYVGEEPTLTEEAQYAQEQLTARVAELETVAGLSEPVRAMLAFALDLADDEMASKPDEFTDEDEAAMAALRKLGGGDPR